jgi:hypothetical protein
VSSLQRSAEARSRSGDYAACVVLLIREEVFFVLEVVRGRFPFETLKAKVMELKPRYQVSTLLIEESPISLGLIQSLRERFINVTKSLSLSYSLFPVATTIRLTLLLKASPGFASGGVARSEHTQSRGFTKCALSKPLSSSSNQRLLGGCGL